MIGYAVSSLVLSFFFVHYPNSLSILTTHHMNTFESLSSIYLMGFSTVYFELIGLFVILLVLGVIARSASSTSVAHTHMLIGSISYLAATVIAAVASIGIVRLVNTKFK